ncbi:MAG: single-stranded-DNA-specific exonuclease RecJ [Gammaproteobacteria bacterium]|nr:single-stranded-DNA-specific exonuclease RecJ [Gammaproteobacteria bacterium]MDH5303278.1 single-stranded-DNA-specific exonuclease RecJ [Gammaproteobacteria bacterium]MDH5322020.1 single-stranded-DNA-specific exonuclease RecJ [Gammaproteobacteria bacterium]
MRSIRKVRPIVQRAMPDASAISALDALDSLYARLYATRGVVGPNELDYALAGLAPVGSLEHIADAVELLLQHREQRIVIVGDFDVDGATSTALLMRCFKAFGFADVDYLVPNRFEYGYGLTTEIVAVAAASKPRLLVTVDNGISSISGVQEAQRRGIAVLVTDHHLPGKELPAADVILNPNLPGSRFPSRNLAGVGVAFYLVAALGRRLEDEGLKAAAKIPAQFLDLVALGTVADVVALDHNNRILVQQGLDRIRAGRTLAGIRALLEQSGRSLSRTVSGDLGFVVGPRINAAGRLQDMSIGIECLLTDDQATAHQHARLLDDINKDRRVIEANMRDQAFAYVDSLDQRRLPSCVCLFEPSWHQGVVGLIASRVRERCHRPVIAFAHESEGFLKGSARSVQSVHVRDLLAAVATAWPGLISKFGGHAMAAGLTIAERDYAKFAAAVDEQMKRLYPDADLSGAIVSDGVLAEEFFNVAFARSLRDAGPWGAGFAEPVWSGDFAVIEQRTVGEKHLKLRVQPAAGGAVVDAIAFNQADAAYRGVVQLAYRLDVNEFRGRESPQLIVEQISSLQDGAAC